MAAYESELSASGVDLTRTRSWYSALAVIAACAVAAIPIFAVELPPLLDFPNHLARIWLIAGGAAHPPLSHIYQIRWWQASTNIAVDFAGSLIARVLPLDATIKALLLPMFLGPPLGAVFLNRALFRNFSAWHLAAFAFVWGALAIEGFLSFQIGLAAALFAAVALRPLLPRPSVRNVAIVFLVAAALLYIHPFATVFLLVLVVGLGIGERVPWPLPRAWALDRALRILPFAVACILPVVGLFTLSPIPPGAYGHGAKLMSWYPFDVAFSLRHLAELYASPFAAYRLMVDIPMLIPVAAVTAWALAVRRMRVHAGLLVAAAPLVVLACVAPKDMGDGGSLPVRMVIMGSLMAFAGVRPEFGALRSRVIFASVLALGALARVGWITSVWTARAKDVKELRLATQPLPPGAPVLVLEDRIVDGAKAPTGRLMSGCPDIVCPVARHMGSLAVIWNHVFIPTLFTVPGQQPLAVRPPWNKKSVYSSHVPYLDEVGKPSTSDPYLDHWHRDFDYILVLDADLGEPFHHRGVRLLDDEGFARLYKIVHRATGR